MELNTILWAFALTLLAGLSTGLGGVVSVLVHRRNTRFLCVSLGFSAGVMIYVSFAEILPQSRQALSGYWGDFAGGWASVLSFFGGILIIGLIDRLVPKDVNPHEAGFAEENSEAWTEAQSAPGSNAPGSGAPDLSGPGRNGSAKNKAALKRTGLFTALALTIHNFPEGMATFTSALTDPALGLVIAAAVAIHNIPEGVAVAVPIYHATGSRAKALRLSFLSGMAEPAGALLGFLILLPVLSPASMGILFGAVAGIMVFISLDELLPAAEEYGEHHLCIYGLIGGMALMAASLELLN